MVKKETVIIEIPKGVIDKIIIETGFKSMSSYVTYILRKVISKEATLSKTDYSEEEEKITKKRLEKIGYI